MRNQLAGLVLPGITALVGAAALGVWMGVRWTDAPAVRIEGRDKAPPAMLSMEDRAVLGEPIRFDVSPSSIAGSWPWFRGPNLDAICRDGVPLARSWPDGGPEKLWEVELGEGYAAAAVSEGRVYVLDHVSDDEVEWLRGLKHRERLELAGAIGALSPEELDGVDTVLRRLFPLETDDMDAPPRIVSRAEYDAIKAALGEIYSNKPGQLLDALRYELPAEKLYGLSKKDRVALADALDTLSQKTFDEVDTTLRKLFPVKGTTAESTRQTVSQEEYGVVRAALRDLIPQRKAELIATLRFDPESGQQPPADLLHPSLDRVDRSTDTMRCLSLDNGRQIWCNDYRVIVTRNHGMSRTVPAVDGDYVVSIGPRAHVACWDAKTGEGRWLLDLVRDYGAKVPDWYVGQCPLIDVTADPPQLVLAPVGRALLMAVDYASETGEVLWESEKPAGWEMTHSSITPMDFRGRRMYVYAATKGVAGVAADDGSILWETTDWTMDFATSPAPVILDGGRIFLSSGYRSASVILQVQENNGQFAVETAARLSRKQFIGEQQTPVLFDGYLYGVRKNEKRLVCLDQEGNEVWNSVADKFGRYGYGPYMIADGLIYVMSDDGWLTMADATPKGYRRLDKALVIEDGHDAWGPMALVAGRLIVRDMTRMVCLDVAAKKPADAR